MKGIHYSFSAADIAAASRALSALAEDFSSYMAEDPGLRSTLLDIYGLINRLRNPEPTFTIGEMQNICLALETVLEKNPMDWNASRLFSALVPLCGCTSE